MSYKNAKPLAYTFDSDLQFVKTATGWQVPAASAVNSRQKLAIFKLQPDTQPASGCLSSTPSQITFRMDRTMRTQNIHYLQNLALKFNIANTDIAANSLLLVDGYSLINRIVFSTAGRTIQTLYGAQLRENLLLMSDSDSKCLGAIDAAYINGTNLLSKLTLLGQTNVDVIVDIFECFATVGDVPLFMLGDDLQIDVYLNYGSSQCLSTGSISSGAPSTIDKASLTNMYFVLAGEQLSDSVYEQQRQTYVKSSPMMFRYTDHQFQALPIGAVTKGVSVAAAAYNVQGSIAMINAYLVDQNAITGDAFWYNGNQIQALDFLNNNVIINHNLGALSYTSEIFEALAPAWLPSQKSISLLPRFYVLFSEAISDSLRSGANWGAFNANSSTSNNQIQIVPNVSITSAAIYTWTVRYSTLLCDFSQPIPDVVPVPGNTNIGA